MLGVMGGMGPLATIDFMRKVVLRSSNSGDGGCVPMLVVNDGRIPDRSSAIMHPKESISPLPDMLRIMKMIDLAEVKAIAIPCNSAHYWINELQIHTNKPIISMIEAVVKQASDLFRSGSEKREVGILGTRGTLISRIYHDLFMKKSDLACEGICDAGQVLVEKIIFNVKQGRLDVCNEFAEELFQLIRRSNIKVWILACTELPVVFEKFNINNDIIIIDATDVLAITVVDLFDSNKLATAWV